MIDFIEYVVNELKSKRLSKEGAISLVKQFTEKNGSGVNDSLHPFLHVNNSDINEQKYKSVFYGDEEFLKDHKISLSPEDTKRVLPGAIYLEMARAAVLHAAGSHEEGAKTQIDNILWLQPAYVDTAFVLNISVWKSAAETFSFELYSGEGESEVIHCQGEVKISNDSQEERFQGVLPNFDSPSLSAKEIYNTFSKYGLHYGDSHQGVEAILAQDGKVSGRVLSRFDYGSNNEISDNAKVCLAPGMLDSCFQTIIGFNLDGSSAGPIVPFGCDSVHVYKSLPEQALVIVSRKIGGNTGLEKFDIEVVDPASKTICVRLEGFSCRQLIKENREATLESTEKDELFLGMQNWEKADDSNSTTKDKLGFTERVLHFVGFDEGEVEQKLGDRSSVSTLYSDVERSSTDIAYQTVAVEVFEKIKSAMQNIGNAKTLYQLVIQDKESFALFSGLLGLLRTASFENPNIFTQLIFIGKDHLGRLTSHESEFIAAGFGQCLKYNAEGLFKRVWEEFDLEKAGDESVYKEGGAYLISGGLGKIGQILAKDILNTTGSSEVYLLGRKSEANIYLSDMFDSKDLDRVKYFSADISNEESLRKVLDSLDGHKLKGIFHAAGVSRDEFFVKKQADDFLDILKPKVNGIKLLGELSSEFDLDFVVSFSSVASVFGNPGQSDYAAANGFLDNYPLTENAAINGKYISINWPLWADGGMEISPELKRSLYETSGMIPMATEVALSVMKRALVSESSQLLVMQGNLATIRQGLNESVPAYATSEEREEKVSAALTDEDFSKRVSRYLSTEFSKLLKMPANRIDPKSPLENYGIDSILAMRFTSHLEEVFGVLPKTLFFEYQTLEQLSGYFQSSHKERLGSLLGLEEKEKKNTQSTQKALVKIEQNNAVRSVRKRPGKLEFAPNAGVSAASTSGIAIVGLSGRYPNSVDIDSYWNNLKDGVDCVTTVPEERWDWSKFYKEGDDESLHNSKWGGFIAGVDLFDPQFFNISPREALHIDPQERLFLQHSWMAIEDAGYTRERLQLANTKGLPAQVGVYAGVMYGEYNLSGSLASIANRVSYVLNLHGPSITLDTMCSSSLTAIHLACEDLKTGKTDLAIAGGVNVTIHPNKYTMLSAGQFISNAGHCQSFGEGGDGYIPGEGVGIVVLKRLEEAEVDANQIYGVIRGSAINHGGKTNGYSVPNPVAQSDVIAKAVENSGIPVERINYIEAHGTGTKLGDPIEIAALSKIFGIDDSNKQYCYVGSAKSNIGHCESAAGIAGLTKILLQMKHRKIVPSLHSAKLNPHIDFKNSAFEVNQNLRDWNAPEKDGKQENRVAGLSSFGAGGSNAHFVIEEYVSPLTDLPENETVLVPLSAHSEKQLQTLIEKLLDTLNRAMMSGEKLNLSSVAYTLQIGREAFDKRLALVVSSIDELTVKLLSIVEGQEADTVESCYQGSASKHKESLDIFTLEEDFQNTLNKWVVAGELSKIAGLWVRGVEVDWQAFYLNNTVKPRIVGLPTSPFDLKKLWVDPVSNYGDKTKELVSLPVTTDTFTLHPVLHKNISTLDYYQYETDLAQLPASFGADLDFYQCCVEMVMAAVSFINEDIEKPSIMLSDLVFGRPFVKTGKIRLVIWRSETGSLEFEIAGSDTVHSQGLIKLAESSTAIAPASAKNIASKMKVVMSEEEGELAFPANAFAGIGDAIRTSGSPLNGASIITRIDSIRYVSSLAGEIDIYVSGGDNLVDTGASKHDASFCNHAGEVCIQISNITCAWQNNSTALPSLQASPQIDSVDFDSMPSNLSKPEGIVLNELVNLSVNADQLEKPKRVLGATHKVEKIETPRIEERPRQNVQISPEPQVLSANEAIPNLANNEAMVNVANKASGVTSSAKNLSGLKRFLKQSLAKALFVDEQDINESTSFIDLGLDSIIGVEWIKAVNKELGEEISATSVYDYSNIKDFSKFIFDNLLVESPDETDSTDTANIAQVHSINETPDQSVSLPTEEKEDKGNTVESSWQLGSVEEALRTSLASALYLPVESVTKEKAFIDLGLDSIIGVEWVKEINKIFATEISATRIYDYATVAELAKYLIQEIPNDGAVTQPVRTEEFSQVVAPQESVATNLPSVEPSSVKHAQASSMINQGVFEGQYPVLTSRIPKNNETEEIQAPRVSTVVAKKDERIAIVGMSGRYPGAENLEQFWDNLVEGKNCVSEIPSSRWDVDEYYDPNPAAKDKMYCKWIGYLDGADEFDPMFFQILPAEAETMDPQHRLFLQESYHAFEDAGYSRDQLSAKKCGVYMGIMSNEYSQVLAEIESENINTTSNSFAVGAARIAYHLNLKGPAIPIDTACSSSLVAVHLARQALVNGEIDMAVAGGVSLYLIPESYVGMCQAGMLSPQGLCKTFDDSANGFVPGEGVGAVILKRLADAEKDKDNIHGVILGSAINQDGKTNGITAPSVNSQIELERGLYERYDIDPNTISYIEAHGTGTKLGDPIELEALSTVYREKSSKNNFCAIGAVKSNLGHTSGAAGVAGIHKVLLSMKHGLMVPSLHVENENTHFNFEKSPFYISKDLKKWELNKEVERRRAAISSFGFSGTNAHLVIEEYKAQENTLIGQASNHIVPIAGRTAACLNSKINELHQFVKVIVNAKDAEKTTVSFQSLAYTLQAGREQFGYRTAVIANSIDDLFTKLTELTEGKSDSSWITQDKNRQAALQTLLSDDDMEDTIERWVSKDKLAKLADFWVNGGELDWQKIYKSTIPYKMSLPRYPFLKEKCWVSGEKKVVSLAKSSNIGLLQQVPTLQAPEQQRREPTSIVYQSEWSQAIASKAQTEQGQGLIVGGSITDCSKANSGSVYENALLIAHGDVSKADKNHTCFNVLESSNWNDYFEKALGEESALSVVLLLESFKSHNFSSLDYFSLLANILKAATKSKKVRGLTFVGVGQHDLGYKHYSGIPGLLKSIEKENTADAHRYIEFDQKAMENVLGENYLSQLIKLSEREYSHIDELRFTAKDKQLEILEKKLKEKSLDLSENALSQVKPSHIKQSGVYLITGGLGALGALVAEKLLREYQGKVYLVGRSGLAGSKQEKLNHLKQFGFASYSSVDITNESELDELVSKILSEQKQLNGVIHCAGVTNDSYLINKDLDKAEAVISTKIAGGLALDKCTKDIQLDFFASFSSVAGVLGNAGQSDYAYANRFLEHFSEVRDAKVADGTRHGKSLNIAWPHWEEGGIALEDSAKNIARMTTGLESLPTKTGLNLWDALSTENTGTYLPLYGNIELIRKIISGEAQSTEAKAPGKTNTSPVSKEILLDSAIDYLKETIGLHTKLGAERIDADERLESYGFDSIVINQFNGILEEKFGELPKTLFYENESVREIAHYLVENKAAVVQENIAGISVNQEVFNTEELETSENTVATASSLQTDYQQVASQQVAKDYRQLDKAEPIAIIGAHGKYPGSDTLDEFWDNLASAKDLVDFVPADRWDCEELFHEDPAEAINGKIYCKTGGFINEVDLFDAEFFNISDEEANIIDPQERLFMQSVWSAIEDAGYTRSTLKQIAPKGKGADVGVFVGVTSNTYGLLAAEASLNGNAVPPSALPWSIANRVSYFFDFKGPSMPVDTACSSSIVAISMAMESLLKGECQVAIAGGVNLLLHKSKYQSFCQRRMLAEHGKTRSFGSGDDGFVPGEGVGSLVLKPLSKAKADGDHIYGSILSCVYDHSGRSNGYSAPNPIAQADLIDRTIAKSGIPAESISFIEGHGTGTQLGDSLEIVAINEAFSRHTTEKGFCGIGSVKSNIGHSESAVGIAGILKTIMQFKHETLAPTLHADNVNPDIDFVSSPCYIQNSESKLVKKSYPHRAMINSFGAGGVNASLILEQNVGEAKVGTEEEKLSPNVFVLSAASQEQLELYVHSIVKHLELNPGLAFHSICYTSQLGRETFLKKMALVASSKEELLELLQAWLKQPLVDTAITGEQCPQGSILDACVDQALQWVQKGKANWQALYKDVTVRPSKISLPAYPFAKKRHWLSLGTTDQNTKVGKSNSSLHPLVSENTSTLRNVSFDSILQKSSDFLKDHVVQGHHMFPGAGFIEIACVAGSIAGEGAVQSIHDLFWINPLIVADDISEVNVKTSLKPIGNSTEFEITSIDEMGDTVVHSEGRLVLDNLAETVFPEQYNLKDKLNQAVDKSNELNGIYSDFRDSGFNYGPTFKLIKNYYLGTNYSVAKIELHDKQIDSLEEYILHPAIMDNALQSVVTLAKREGGEHQYMPFAIDSIYVYGAIPKVVYAIAEPAESEGSSNGGDMLKYDLVVASETGGVVAKINGFYLRKVMLEQSRKDEDLNLLDNVDL